MTEDQAKKKWCPMVRQVAIDDDNQVLNSTSYNRCAHEVRRESFSPNGSKRIASGCMMWQKLEQAFRSCDYPSVIDEPERPDSVPANWEWIGFQFDDNEPAGWLEPVNGYCGLTK